MHAYCLEWCWKHTQNPAVDILDVGSGSGYLAAAFARLYPQSHVTGIEIVPELVQWSVENMKRYDASLLSGGRVKLVVGNGWKSLGDQQFDLIHVGAAAATVPEELLRAMKPGALMIIPVGPQGDSQEIYQIRKDANGKIEKQSMMGVRYVPLVQERK